jgi:pyrimidine-specific ribonucleoside hydrolase
MLAEIGDVPSAKEVVAAPRIPLKRFVSKNVCHGVIYDGEMHLRMLPYRFNNSGLNELIGAMGFYLENKPSGKAFHDPLAACAAIDSSILKWAEVKIYREKGEWGSHLTEVNDNSPTTFISINLDRDKFEQVLIGNC